MILLDANILLYAYNEDAPKHKQARELLQDLFNGDSLVGLPCTSVWAFLRISTHSQVFSAPYTEEEACAIVSSWMTCPNVRMIAPSELHWGHLLDLLQMGQVRGPLVMDAALAAMALESGAEIWTTDRDFSRFPGVRSRNPFLKQPGGPK